ncbi:MAG TPA: hypothetical protein VHS76_18120 [Steroidobacteraceae bacterium]|jgi:hypothetical protein|nr:hypothetical protein [Steroidobacteraceae bacterium]
MRGLRTLVVVALSIGVLVLDGCARQGNAPAAAASNSYVVLDDTDQPLREDFNRDRGFVRLMFLVDPRCPECLRGLEDMGQDVLAALPKNARIKVYVVNEPVIGGTTNDIPAAAELLHATLARQYWNPSGNFGREMSKTLNYWNGHRWVYAWDTWLIYPADATWEGPSPPQPAFLMHQLGGLDNAKFPFLDTKVFAVKAAAMLKNTDSASGSL